METKWFYLRNLCVDDVPVFLSLAQRDHISQKLASLLNLTQDCERKTAVDHAVGWKSCQQDYLYLLEICLSPPCLACGPCLKPRVCLLLDLWT